MPMEDIMRRVLFLVPAFVGLAVPSVTAEEPGRYTLEKSATGYARMDTRTGEMSICEERAGQLVCKLAADERAAFQDEIDRMEEKLGALEQRLAAVEQNPILSPQNLLPTDEQFEKSLGYMERFFRRFMDIVRDMDKGADDQQKT
ncbi:hypothetical protein MesoLjLb_70310 [Mesorhizobium sp. L-8-3]|nr:hypothetical protein MesoLjLb_70310 [Mesorhizobium sp. L-8-3]